MAVGREPRFVVTGGATEFTLGGDLPVHRIGYGNRHLTGPGYWGPPADRKAAHRVLQRAVELGVEFIDTADAYGPSVAEALTAEALYPYPSTLVIATKGGMVRTGPREWHPVGRPEYLRQQCELSLRCLRLERIDLYQLHRIDPKVPVADQLGVLADLQREGKIRHIGLCGVTLQDVEYARQSIPVVSVQNRYNLIDRVSDPLVAYCEQQKMGFIPWFPLAQGELSAGTGPIARLARRAGVTPSQLALAWLLARSPVVIPIPGTASLAHLQENCAAADISLSVGDIAAIEELGRAET